MRNFSRSRFHGSYRQNRRPFRRYRPSRGVPLNPLMFVKKAVDVAVVPYAPEHSFSDFALEEAVKRNVAAHGFSRPTAIQDRAIEPILQGRDLVGVADTGTGKTAAFLLPLLSKVARDRRQKVLIVTPTRELAAQIRAELKLFSRGMGIFSALCIGGASLGFQARELSRRPNFVIGTPGRIKDLQQRRLLHLEQYANVVLDEVDRMLDMGFIQDIRQIISLLPLNRQSLFFSATVPEKTKAVMQDFLKDPVMVSIKSGVAAHNIDQDIIRVRGRSKLEILHELLIKKEFKKVLVFGRTKRGVSRLESSLIEKGFKAVAIHGNKSQRQRSRALRMLKNNEVQVLLATDVASRGIDVEDITHVINYDAPQTYGDYTHRIGRTGRAGKKGVAITFVD